MLWFKKLTVPVDNAVKSVDVLQLWEVRWTSRHGEYSADTMAEAEFFTSEAEFFTSEAAADDFAESLRAAFKLTRNTSVSEIKVTVRPGAAH